ncbi:hypothetical protein ACWDGI_11170 [Streptomyces sp. NPDC001220]
MNPPLSRGSTFLLAAPAGTATANNYAVQPALTAVAADLDVPLATIGLVPTAALTGCMTGFALLLDASGRQGATLTALFALLLALLLGRR